MSDFYDNDDDDDMMMMNVEVGLCGNKCPISALRSSIIHILCLFLFKMIYIRLSVANKNITHVPFRHFWVKFRLKSH